MPQRFYPFIFVILWASAFISAKYGLMGAGPFSFLFTRFLIVSAIFGVMVLVMRRRWPQRKDILPTMIAQQLIRTLINGWCTSIRLPSAGSNIAPRTLRMRWGLGSTLPLLGMPDDLEYRSSHRETATVA